MAIRTLKLQTRMGQRTVRVPLSQAVPLPHLLPLWSMAQEQLRAGTQLRCSEVPSRQAMLTSDRGSPVANTPGMTGRLKRRGLVAAIQQ